MAKHGRYRQRVQPSPDELMDLLTDRHLNAEAYVPPPVFVVHKGREMTEREKRIAREFTQHMRMSAKVNPPPMPGEILEIE